MFGSDPKAVSTAGISGLARWPEREGVLERFWGVEAKKAAGHPTAAWCPRLLAQSTRSEFPFRLSRNQLMGG